MRLPINGSPSVGGAGANLGFFLIDIDAPEMRERVGRERVVDFRPFGRFKRDEALTPFVLLIAQGVSFRRSSGGSVTAFRYLVKDGGTGEGVAVAQIVRVGREWTLANIFVRGDWRRQGLGSLLVETVRKDHPTIRVDANLTEAGAAFFGYASPPPVTSLGFG